MDPSKTPDAAPPTPEFLRAPGRRRIARKGRFDAYWVASRAAVAAGFRPETVRLAEDPGAPEPTFESAAACRRLQAEMLEFLASAQRRSRAPAGTIAWVVNLYRTDPESRYRDVRPGTQKFYDRALDIIVETVGDRLIEEVTASLVRAWHRDWGRHGENPRRAYACVQALRVALKFGKGERLRGCAELSSILSDAEFPVPRGRSAHMTQAHALAIIAAAHERGRPSIARAVALQFGCALRQKDVIGEWINGRWSAGLLWGEHIKADWTLAKPTSKSNFKEIAEFDLALIPITLGELQKADPLTRIGPVIVDEFTKQPYRQRAFARMFRKIAQDAGVPDDVFNMDARAGAVTDAYNKGAAPTDAMDLATHKNLSTSRRYARDRLAATGRISELRFGVKPKPDKP